MEHNLDEKIHKVYNVTIFKIAQHLIIIPIKLKKLKEFTIGENWSSIKPVQWIAVSKKNPPKKLIPKPIEVSFLRVILNIFTKHRIEKNVPNMNFSRKAKIILQATKIP